MTSTPSISERGKAPTHSARQHKRDKSLDGLRGCAVLLVVISHISGRLAEDFGATGVTIFFVLSGYLITGILLKEDNQRGSIDLRVFYLRRAFRLAPAFLLLIAATPVILWAVNDPRLHSSAAGLVTSALYIQDYASASGHGSVLMHSWSLAVEEQFYLVWPALLIGILALGRHRRGFATRTIMILLLTAGLWHVIATFLLSGQWTYFAFDTNAALLLTGCMLAAVPAIIVQLQNLPRWMPAITITLLCTAPLVITHFQKDHWRDSNVLTLAVAAGTVIVIAGAKKIPFLRNPILVWFGRISYGLYLWHVLLLTLEPNGHEVQGLQRPLMVLLSIGLAALSWYFFESPILKFKGRYERTTQIANSQVYPPQERTLDLASTEANSESATNSAMDLDFTHWKPEQVKPLRGDSHSG